ncbi:MAG: hypothetical protein EA409_05470 [Saprospirales bacterium]|nr:MAG: hypothetical protein EA409_05470 [Saprospirales bacterium]
MILFRPFLLLCVLVLFPGIRELKAQIGFGVHFGNDLYQYLSNDEDRSDYSNTSTILLAPYVGPKLYVGNPNWSLSLQTAIGISPFSWDWSEYKGLGNLFLPSSIAANFGGLSGLTENQASWGFSVGIGYVLGMTDLYFRNEEIRGEGGQLIGAPFLQAALGFGAKGTSVSWYIRYGQNPNSARFFSTGIALDINFFQRQKFR